MAPDTDARDLCRLPIAVPAGHSARQTKTPDDVLRRGARGGPTLMSLGAKDRQSQSKRSLRFAQKIESDRVGEARGEGC
jgi:hypothetical protein